MTKPRKQRSDSVTAQVLAFQRRQEYAIPEGVTLRECDKPFWASALELRDDWTAIDLSFLAQLAHAMAEIERLQREIDQEGSVIAAKPNLKLGIVETLARRVMSLSRHLQIHALATRGTSREVSKRPPAPVVELDDLIAR